MSKTLFVGNLSFQITSAGLREAFGHFGTVTRAEIFASLAYRARDFGVVEMTDGGDEAIAALNGSEFQGRVLTVNEARVPLMADHPATQTRRRMEERVAHHAASGAGVSGRLGQLERDAERGGCRTVGEMDEQHALQALRGDFQHLSALTPADDRADVARFEGEGGRATEQGEVGGHDQHDNAAVAEALLAPRGPEDFSQP